jgi:hypothetical protein
MKQIRNAGLVISGAFFTLCVLASSALAQAPDPVDVVGDGAEGLQDTLLAIGVRVLPYAAAVLALTIGWRFAKKFVRGS